MVRPTTIQDDALIRAARKVFLERGGKGTSAEVAREAGVSEGTLFKRFGTKEALFARAMASQHDEPAWTDRLMERVGKTTIEDQLFALGLELVAHFSALVPIMMMAWSNSAFSAAPKTRMPAHNIRRLTAYFDAEMKAGRLVARDPHITARCFASSFQSYALLDIATDTHKELPTPLAKYVRGIVDVIVAAPARPAPAKKSPKKAQAKSAASAQKPRKKA